MGNDNSPPSQTLQHGALSPQVRTTAAELLAGGKWAMEHVVGEAVTDTKAVVGTEISLFC